MIPKWTDEQAAELLKANLRELLLCELWPPVSAFRVLCGLSFEPPDEHDPDGALDGLLATPEQRAAVDRLERHWEIAGHRFDERHPPQWWIEWAQLRGHVIPWHAAPAPVATSNEWSPGRIEELRSVWRACGSYTGAAKQFGISRQRATQLLKATKNSWKI